MAAIINVGDLPTDLQTTDLINAMVDGANAKSSRVAPCLVEPSSAWAADTAYALGSKVRLGEGVSLQASVSGTSGAAAPSSPEEVGDSIIDGTVTWVRVAPTLDQLAEARLILLGAVKRWAEAGTGAFQSQTAGPFGVTVDTRQRTGFNLWPTEIASLQEICATDGEKKAFSVDTAPSLSGTHADWCSLKFAANFCSCGADIAGTPLWEEPA